MRLEIYVGHHCLNCEEALLIAEQARAIEGIEVVVIDLDQSGQSAPPRVIAVPTYVLDGKVVSLGNPARDTFLALLHQPQQERAS
jgi:predicted thioredoxin/glutaredoxin